MPGDTTWPPKCGWCDGLGCDACDGAGDAAEWKCAACGSVIDAEERPARIGERNAVTTYTCAECDRYPAFNFGEAR